MNENENMIEEIKEINEAVEDQGDSILTATEIKPVEEVIDPTAPMEADDNVAGAPVADENVFAGSDVPAPVSDDEIDDEVAVDDSTPAEESAGAKRARAIRNEARRERRAAAGGQNMAIRAILKEAAQPMTNKRVLTSRIISARPASGDIPPCAVVSILDTGLTAIIPFNEFFSTDPLASEGEIPARVRAARQFRLIRNSLGAVIPFVILQAESEGNSLVALASRNAAMRRMQAVNFFNRNPNRSIQANRIYNANIIAVDGGGHTMWVELGGAECRLFPGQITYRPLLTSSALRDLGFEPGRKIRVLVRELELDPNTRTVTNIVLSAADAELGTFEQRLSQAIPESEAMGVITRYNTSPGHFRALVWLDDLKIPARIVSFPRFTPGYIGVGSRVSCSILSVDRDGDGHDPIPVRVRVTRFYGVSSGMML